MNAKSMIPLVVGLAIGGYALKLVIDTVKKAKGAEPDMVQVWTAREDIPRGSSIDEAMILSVKFPAGALPEGAFMAKEELVGRVPRLIAPAGLPILESMLLAPGAKAGLWVRPGFRAVSIKIDESSGVSNLLQPGSWVDVIGYFRVTKSGKQETISRTLIENVEVAAVGARISVVVEEGGKKRGVKPARAVTLLVKPESVPKIHLAEQMGKIKLSMRNSNDSSVRNVNDISRESDVLGLPADDVVQSTDNGKFMDKIKAMFQKRDHDIDSKLKALERQPLTIASVDRLEPAWVMRVWNGERRIDLGWNSLDSMEPIELSPPSSDKTKSNITPGQAAVKPAASIAEKDSRPATDEPAADWGSNDHVPE